MADDLGYGELGCYGQKIIKTPAIDKLAEGGMKFTHFYAGCAVCAPSRCALMTGRHTGHATVRNNVQFKKGEEGQFPLRAADVTVTELLKDKGYVTRGWLGVQVQPVTTDIADSLGIKQARGAIVDEPQPGSPAAKAGIAAGDVITAVNGTAIKDSRALARTISMMAPGTSVKLDILHQGQSKPVTVTLGELPNEHQANSGREQQSKEALGTPHLGLSLAPAKEVQGAGDKGVAVISVDPEGPAAEHGVRTGDVILNVGGKTVANAEDVRSALKEANSAGKHSVLLQVKTADATKFVAVPLANG